MQDKKEALNNESTVPNNMLSHPLADSNLAKYKNGYIKLYRSLLDWEWYADANVMRVFIHCLLKANHTVKKWQGHTIHAGQFITSLSHLAKETGLTEQKIRTAINKLKSTQELTSQSTSRNTLITINNWEKWQSEQHSEQQTDNKQITTTNNDKNIYNKEEKIFRKPTLEEIKNYCLERNNLIIPEKFYNYYEANGWMVGKSKMKNWKAAIRTWETNQTKFNQTKDNVDVGGAEYVWNPNL